MIERVDCCAMHDKHTGAINGIGLAAAKALAAWREPCDRDPVVCAAEGAG
jgi:hypothetical protein